MSQAAQPPSGPAGLEIVASAATAAVIVALGWASYASHAQIPFLWGVDLGIHEFGHMVTQWAPWPVYVAAGSFFQVAVPLALGGYFVWKGQYRAAAILVAWAGCSARNVAVYIGDAPYQRLALWGGEGVVHDWAQLLAGRQMMYAEQIAWAVNAFGWLLVAAGLTLAVAPVARQIAQARKAQAREAEFAARRDELPVREPHKPIG